jgi:hypothetical protein
MSSGSVNGERHPRIGHPGKYCETCHSKRKYMKFARGASKKNAWKRKMNKEKRQ